ncbi:MAG TPA: MlaD family protein [Candidatus Binatus sp.]|jgi:paraquat-inducible protein B|nr:MlaD family protein [Candidatus Binatus sp.]
MGKKTNPALIGAFVIGAIILVVVAVVVWGKGQLFETSQLYVAYFKGSVNGLTKGAPVKFRGVQIGEVTDIHLRYKQVRGDPRVPVFFKVDEGRVAELGGARPTRDAVGALISQGWRARLQTLSLVTGVLYVEFDLVPGSTPDFVQSEDATYMEVPTVPTVLEEATATVSDILANLKAIDFAGIGKGISATLERVDGVLDRPELDLAIAELPKTIAAVGLLATNLDHRTEPLTTSLRGTSDEARRSVESLRTTLDGVHSLLAPDGPLAVQLTQTVADLGRAARALRELADYLERNPNAVLFGRAKDAQ